MWQEDKFPYPWRPVGRDINEILEQDEQEMKESHTPGTGEGGEKWFRHALPLRLQEAGSGQDISLLIIFICFVCPALILILREV